MVLADEAQAVDKALSAQGGGAPKVRPLARRRRAVVVRQRLKLPQAVHAATRAGRPRAAAEGAVAAEHRDGVSVRYRSALA